MEKIKIIKGLPIQEIGQVKARERMKYPFAEMEVGDSFHIAGVKEGRLAMMAAHAWEKNKYVQEWVCRDGFVLVKPAPDLAKTWVENEVAWIKQTDEAARQHGEGRFIPVAYKKFKGEQIDGGWMISRIANVPISAAEGAVIDGRRYIGEIE